MGISVQAAEGDSKSGQGGQMTQEEALKLLDEQMQKMDTAIRTGMSQAAEKYKSANFPTDLPPRDKVVEAKDSKSLNMYGGLCEKYLFQDNVEKAEDLRNWIAKNASTICGADDPSPGLIDGDFALYYYDKGDFKKAEPLCINSIKLLEPAVASHKVSFLSLISTYACEAE
ncbi:MAG TPA: hypothetical protein VFA15_01695, partial [Nitrososphaera sp.]|nr:hypothetical protein [Nitrososphaera sp.]